MSENSYRTVLRASSIIGGASALNILTGIVRAKVVAVLLGPAGVGLIGLYYSLMQTAGQIAGLGIYNSGTRQVASAGAEGGAASVGRVRRALFWGTLLQAVLGAGLFWLASPWIANHILAVPDLVDDVAWLAIGVGLGVAGGSQAALLAGLRRIGDIARVQVGAVFLSSFLGVAALLLWGEDALLAMVLIAPAVSFALGHIYVSRIGPPAGQRPSVKALAGEWSVMVRLGAAFMISGLVTVAGFLVVRVLVQRELGADALGQFQAAWAIGMTYLGFVLGAMGTDYYPRLTAAIGDGRLASRLVNEQTEVALLLCGPVLVAMLGLAPWVIQLLYSIEFSPAVSILRWQLLGDILKVMSWPLGIVLLASAAGKTYIFTESVGISVFVLGVAIGLPVIGLAATGVAFLGLYVAYLPLVWWMARRKIGMRWSRAVKAQALLLIAAAVVVEVAARSSDLAGAVSGTALSAVLGVWAVLRLSAVTKVDGRLAPLARLGERVRAWVLRSA